MCRLLGFVSPVPTTLAELIGGAQCATFQHMSRLHADGWGTMWLTGENTVERRRIATPGQDDAALTQAMTEVPTTGRVVHLRMATDGMPVRKKNSHPFLADGIGLAHNGSLVPTGLLRRNLSPAVLADVHGDTDSELYLAAIRQGVRVGLSLSDAAWKTANWLRAAYPVASLNALILSPDAFVVVHASSFATAPYDDFTASGLNDDLPLDHLEEYYQMSYLRGEGGAIAFSSTGIDRTGWLPIPDESVMTVDLRSFELTARALEPATSQSAA
jgi:predicted glutamine amidotransferase